MCDKFVLYLWQIYGFLLILQLFHTFFVKAGKEFATYSTTEELIEALKAGPLKGYHILIKGSHGMALEKTIEFL